MTMRGGEARLRFSIRAAVAVLLSMAAALAAPIPAAAQIPRPEPPPPPSARPAPADAAAHGAATSALYAEAAARLATRTPADLDTSLRLFSEVARREPDHALAHAGAATAASLLALYSVAPPGNLFAIARAAAAEALRLDPDLAQAHAARGLVAYLDAWDFAAAESSLREALRLEDTYATAWHWYGMLLMATARFDESLAAFDRALALEPASSLYRAKRGAVLTAAGRAKEAEKELRSAIERSPDSQLAYRELGYLLLAGGRQTEGVETLRRAAELTVAGAPASPDLAWAYARTGRTAEAEAILASMLDRAAFEFVPPLDLALVNAGLERRDEAFRWIDAAIESRDPGLVYLATAPGFVPLRGDARFAAALEKIGLARAGKAAKAAKGRPAAERNR